MATTTVSSGGVTTQGNRTYLFGTSSGIDTSALVEVAYNARKSEADKIDVKVTKNTAKIDAYTKLQTLGTAVQTSLANLRKSYGYSSTTNNYIFDSRSGTLSTDTSTDPSKLLTVAIDPGTTLGAYNIEVVQKAKANRIGSATTADATVALGYAGSFSVGLAGNTASAINVTSGMSMTDIAAAVNATTTTSGVSASVLKVAEGSYQLIFSGSTTAKDIMISGVTGTNVLQSIGMTSGTTPANVLQAAQQAIIKLDDVTITRDSNQIDDLIAGVHLTINNAEPGTHIDLDVTNDTSALKDAIMGFTEAYNAFRDYVITNQTVTDGSVSDDAVLYGDTIMKSMMEQIQALVPGSYGSGGTALSTLREIGITLDDSNKFVVDQTVLDNAIVSKYDEVKSMFTAKVTIDNSDFAIISNTSKQKNISVSLNITYSGGNISNISANGIGGLFDITGSNIVGKKGTIYEGLSMAYIGTSSAVVSLNIQQGIADIMDSTLKDFTDGLTGSLFTAKTSLSDQNIDMNTRATRILERADDYRSKLIDKYASYETQIAQSKSILAQLKAILGTTDN